MTNWSGFVTWDGSHLIEIQNRKELNHVSHLIMISYKNVFCTKYIFQLRIWFICGKNILKVFIVLFNNKFNSYILKTIDLVHVAFKIMKLVPGVG